MSAGAAQGDGASIAVLTYELLDAHADTARLADEDATDAEWQRHLAYLTDLQRIGRETLARAATAPACAGAGSLPLARR